MPGGGAWLRHAGILVSFCPFFFSSPHPSPRHSSRQSALPAPIYPVKKGDHGGVLYRLKSSERGGGTSWRNVSKIALLPMERWGSGAGGGEDR